MEGTDIIAAIATGAGSAAVGIVRLSGTGCHRLVLGLCPGLAAAPEARRLTLAWLVHPGTGDRLDQALVALFDAGASYTGEEAVELSCHGGPRVLDRVLRACLDGGARPARPGEFTRRAMAAGRLDLVQAEAVALLAGAPGDGAVDAALSALAGRPSGEIGEVREILLDVLAEVEASLDFDASDGVYVDPASVAPALAALGDRVEAWLGTARENRPALAGFRVALVGAPNAGKSSLFNALLGRDRSIVHGEPGTTRDVVGESLVLDGATVVLLDTAGLREAPGEVEAEGVARARAAARDARSA